MAGNLLNISELKKHLGDGFGLRKNKYLLELPVGIDGGRSINFLVQAVSLPERNMTTSYVWHKGRKYNVRGETEYPGTYEISLVDDSEMSKRKIFDDWMFRVDNPNFGDSTDGPNNKRIDPGSVSNFLPTGDYKTTINIYQLDSTGTKKLYGYALQNAFPSSLGAVELADAEENTLSEFTISITYSEFVPIDGAHGDITGRVM